MALNSVKRCDSGSILIEFLLSMTLFLVVLLPITRVFVRMTGTDRATDIISAGYLAREHLMLLMDDSSERTKSVTINRRLFHITRDVNEERPGLLRLKVEVFRGSESFPLVRVTTMHFYRKSSEEE